MSRRDNKVFIQIIKKNEGKKSEVWMSLKRILKLGHKTVQSKQNSKPEPKSVKLKQREKRQILETWSKSLLLLCGKFVYPAKNPTPMTKRSSALRWPVKCVGYKNNLTEDAKTFPNCSPQQFTDYGLNLWIQFCYCCYY